MIPQAVGIFTSRIFGTLVELGFNLLDSHSDGITRYTAAACPTAATHPANNRYARQSRETIFADHI